MNRFGKACMTPYMALGTVVSLCMMIAFTGCSGNIEPEVPADEVVVSLRLDQVFQEKAYVRLNHDGSQDDYWFYIVTEDLETEAGYLIFEDYYTVTDYTDL